MFPGRSSYPLLVAGLHEAYEYHSYKPHEYHIHAGRALWLEFPVAGRKRGVVLDTCAKQRGWRKQRILASDTHGITATMNRVWIG